MSDMFMNDLRFLRDAIYGFEKKINDIADETKHLNGMVVTQSKTVETMADGYQDMRDRLSRIEGELNADRKTDVHVNASTNIDKVNQSGSGSSVIDQSTSKTHE